MDWVIVLKLSSVSVKFSESGEANVTTAPTSLICFKIALKVVKKYKQGIMRL